MGLFTPICMKELDREGFRKAEENRWEQDNICFERRVDTRGTIISRIPAFYLALHHMNANGKTGSIGEGNTHS